MSEYESTIVVSAIIFCWVMMPICYYLGFRDGKLHGFRKGLPYGALAFLVARAKDETKTDP